MKVPTLYSHEAGEGRIRYDRLIYLLLCSAFVVYTALALFHPIGGYGVETDFYGSYAVEAFHLLHGGSYQEPDHGPGYSLALIPFYLIFGDMFWAGKIVTILSTLIVIFVSYKLFSALFNDKLAFLTALLLAVGFVPFAYLASNDLFFAALSSLCLYLFYRDGRITTRGLVMTGLVAGYAFMTRLNAVVLPAWLTAALLVMNPEKWQVNKRIRALAVFGLAFLVTAAPWLIMNTLHRGNPLATDVYQTIGAGMGKQADIAWAEEKGEVAVQYHSLLDVLLADPMSTARIYVKNVVGHFRKVFSDPDLFPVYLFVVPGLLMMIVASDRRQLSVLFFPLFGFLIYCILPFMSRFYLYILPFFMLGAAYFMVWPDMMPGANSLSNVRLIRWVNSAAFTFAVVFLLWNVTKATKRDLAADPTYLLKVSRMLKAQGLEGESIIARKPHLGFISGMKVVYFPEAETFPALVDYAKANDARLVLYSNVEEELRPQFRKFHDPEEVARWFSLVCHYQKAGVWVYRVNPEDSSRLDLGSDGS